MEPEITLIQHESVISLLIRIVLGILFLFQGIDKVFKLGIPKVTSTFRAELGAIKIPRWILYISALFTSYVELIGGALLIVGLFKYYAALLLGLDLVLVVLAFSMIQPLWDMRYVWPRLILLAILLYLPPDWDVFLLDRLIMK